MNRVSSINKKQGLYSIEQDSQCTLIKARLKKLKTE
jgi:hypothetical protein